MDYEDFELQIGPASGDGFVVRLRSPAGEAEGLLRLPEACGRLPGAPPARRRDLQGEEPPGPGGPTCAGSPAEIGAALFDSVFSGPIGRLFHQSLSRVEALGRGLRLQLRFNARDPALTPLLELPWELLYREETEDFLALQRSTPVVRALDVPRPAERGRFEPPLRILLVASQDPGSPALDLAGELERLRGILGGNPALRVEVLDHPDPGQIRQVLDREPFHVLHFMGHGGFDPQTGEGALLFRAPDGGRLAVNGRNLATKVKDFDSLRLVVLNACDTARARGDSGGGPFAGVATALVLGGVPAVVAMQSPVADAHALAFSAAFYDRLARGLPIEESVTEGRQAIHSLDPETADWAIPVLFQRTPSKRIVDAQAPAERPRPPARRVRMAVALVALLLLASGASVFDRLWLEPVSRDPGAAEPDLPRETPAREPENREPEAREPEPETRSADGQEEREPEPPKPTATDLVRPPAPVPSYTETISGTLFEIFPGAAEVPVAAILEEIREASSSLEDGAMGRNVRLELAAPRKGHSSYRGEQVESCALTAIYRAPGFGRAEGVGAGIAAKDACHNAATDLGKILVEELVSFARLGLS